jgi:hypothetical protein
MVYSNGSSCCGLLSSCCQPSGALQPILSAATTPAQTAHWSQQSVAACCMFLLPLLQVAGTLTWLQLLAATMTASATGCHGHTGGHALPSKPAWRPANSTTPATACPRSVPHAPTNTAAAPIRLGMLMAAEWARLNGNDKHTAHDRVNAWLL